MAHTKGCLGRGYRVRKLAVVLAFAFLVAGCGEQELTNEDVEAMGEQEAIAMLNCQFEKAGSDLGRQEAISRYGEAWSDSIENDGDKLQVILARDGYACPSS